MWRSKPAIQQVSFRSSTRVDTMLELAVSVSCGPLHNILEGRSWCIRAGVPLLQAPVTVVPTADPIRAWAILQHPLQKAMLALGPLVSLAALAAVMEFRLHPAMAFAIVVL